MKNPLKMTVSPDAVGCAILLGVPGALAGIYLAVQLGRPLVSDPNNVWAPQLIGGAGMVGAGIGVALALLLVRPRGARTSAVEFADSQTENSQEQLEPESSQDERSQSGASEQSLGVDRGAELVVGGGRDEFSSAWHRVLPGIPTSNWSWVVWLGATAIVVIAGVNGALGRNNLVVAAALFSLGISALVAIRELFRAGR